GIAYLTLHLAVTAVVLLWLNRRRPAAFPFVRTTLLVASALALVGFLAYPAAPPRLAGIGIADTVSSGDADPNHRRPPSRARQLALQPVRGRPEHAVGFRNSVRAGRVASARRSIASHFPNSGG